MPATAALSEVPFPLINPVMLVDRVIAGVDDAVATEPAKPLALTIDAPVTVPALPHVGADAPLEVNT